MNNNCLVTKLKGNVDNQNLPYFGECTFVLTGVGDRSNRTFFLNSQEEIKYIAEGVENLTIDNLSASLTGTMTPNVLHRIAYDGSGTFKARSKYNFTEIELGSAVELGEIENDFSMFNNDFYIGRPQGVVNVTRGTIKCKNYLNYADLTVPIPRDFSQFGNIELIPFEQVRALLENDKGYLDISIYNNLTEGGLSGDLCSIFNIKNLDQYYPYTRRIRFVERKCTVSDISRFSVFTDLRRLILQQVAVSGNVIDTFKVFTKLDFFNPGRTATGLDWAPVFDAWKTSGVMSKSIQFAISSANNATANGTPLPSDGYIVFDDAGNWTIQQL